MKVLNYLRTPYYTSHATATTRILAQILLRLSIDTMLLGANAWQAQALRHTFGIPCKNESHCSVVFNLTFSPKVIRSNEILYSLHAKVIDSCIDIIISRHTPRTFSRTQSPILHSRVSSNSPSVSKTYRFPSGWWSVPMGCNGTERSWSLLLAQYAEQGPQRRCLRTMRDLHRRCAHPTR